jgi:transcriptional regulator with XRE-family HTH domain
MQCPLCEGCGEIEAPNMGALVLIARKRANLTQAELAKLVGCSRANIANIEVGRSDTPVNKIRTFAKALGVSVEDLIP